MHAKVTRSLRKRKTPPPSPSPTPLVHLTDLDLQDEESRLSDLDSLSLDVDLLDPKCLIEILQDLPELLPLDLDVGDLHPPPTDDPPPPSLSPIGSWGVPDLDDLTPFGPPAPFDPAPSFPELSSMVEEGDSVDMTDFFRPPGGRSPDLHTPDPDLPLPSPPPPTPPPVPEPPPIEEDLPPPVLTAEGSLYPEVPVPEPVGGLEINLLQPPDVTLTGKILAIAEDPQFDYVIIPNAIVAELAPSLAPAQKPGKIRYICKQCGNAFTDKASLVDHEKEHRVKALVCEICGDTFPDNKTYNHHLNSHAKDRPQGCDMCPSTFAFKSDLVKHLKTHTGERPFQCATCARSFHKKEEFNEHVKEHEEAQPPPPLAKTGLHKCPNCQKCFPDAERAQRHTKEECDAQFRCPVCRATFKWRSHFDVHLRIHRKDQTYQCKFCSKTFPAKATLETHLNSVHFTAKPEVVVQRKTAHREMTPKRFVPLRRERIEVIKID